MFHLSAPLDRSDNLSLHELLSQCAANLTERVARDEVPRAYGRDAEVEQVLTSLASPLKGRILVTGGARVGKTTLINEVARRIQSEDCPQALAGSQLWSLGPRSVLRAFGVRGWQERLGMLLEKWSSHPEVILVVDGLPSLMAAGATMDDPFDMAQFFLGQFQSSETRILAEGRTAQVNNFLTTYPEYKHVLMEVRISEPDTDDARAMIDQATDWLEDRHSILVEPAAVEAALDVTRRFALNEYLPGKAMDLIAEAIALRTAADEPDPSISDENIIARFQEKTGLPRMLLTDDELFDEEMVRRHFNDLVLGQEQAVDVVVQTLSLLRTRLNNPSRPMGVFLFIGSTGVGKTELARVLSRYLFGSDDLIVRFNMADYTQEWHTSTLFGDPHGFNLDSRRGQFTMRLQDHAFAVILLDEFEKAHPEVFQHFLQLFDEGVLINGASEMVNLRNTIVILTSNFGAQILANQKIGFGPRSSLEEQEQVIREEMVRFFSPEFINRIDSVVFFKPLTKHVLREIAYRRVQEILQREGLSRRGLRVEVDEDVIEWVVEHGYSERYGARYLARQIEKTITYPLAQQVIRNDPPEGSVVRLFLHEGHVASALSLPATAADGALTISLEEVPDHLTLDYMRHALPLIKERLAAIEQAAHIDDTRRHLSDMMRRLSSPAFWDDPRAVPGHLTAMSELAGQIERVDGIRRNAQELESLLEGDTPTELGEAAVRFRYIVRELPRAETISEAPAAVVKVTPVGTRLVAARWANELVAMYVAWAERSGLRVEQQGEDILRIHGVAPIFLGPEQGIHQLIQPHPDDPDRRQIVRAVVEVVHNVAQLADKPEGDLIRTYYRNDRVVAVQTGTEHPDPQAVLAGELELLWEDDTRG